MKLKLYWHLFTQWLFETFTPKGRKQKADRLYYGDALAGFQATETVAQVVQNKVYQSANKELDQNKILGFNKGKSVVKPKTTKHKLSKVVGRKNKEILEATGQKFDSNKLKVVKDA